MYNGRAAYLSYTVCLEAFGAGTAEVMNLDDVSPSHTAVPNEP
jgi:hypothetical protein